MLSLSNLKKSYIEFVISLVYKYLGLEPNESYTLKSTVHDVKIPPEPAHYCLGFIRDTELQNVLKYLKKGSKNLLSV